jgi:ATP-dependent Clp protease ATP-binding subunit ClpA
VRSDPLPEEPTEGFDDSPVATDDRRLSAELRSVVFSARRRAARDGDRQIDTAHLLHSLLECDPRSREALGDGTGKVARVLAYLVQRSIGYGMRWQGTVEDSGALPVTAVRVAPGWSPSATAALRDALSRAAGRGADPAEGLDLLAALAADPGCRAVQVLRSAGVDPQRLATTPLGRNPAGPARPTRGFADDGPVAS